MGKLKVPIKLGEMTIRPTKEYINAFFQTKHSNFTISDKCSFGHKGIFDSFLKTKKMNPVLTKLNSRAKILCSE